MSISAAQGKGTPSLFVSLSGQTGWLTSPSSQRKHVLANMSLKTQVPEQLALKVLPVYTMQLLIKQNIFSKNHLRSIKQIKYVFSLPV